MRGNSQPVAIILIIILLLGVVIGVKPIRQKIFGQRGGPSITGTTPTPTQAPGDKGTPVPTQAPIGGNKSERYGVNTGIGPNEPYNPQAFILASQAGIGLVRGLCDWHDLEPSDNNFNFLRCDSFVDNVRGKGMTVVLQLIVRSSSFCNNTSLTGGKNLPQCTDEQISDLFSKVVSHYGSKVAYYEVDNEPDLVPHWKDTPDRYARVLHFAYTGVKSANPAAKVLLGGLAACSGQNCSANFGPAILKDPNYPALQNFDIMNYHTYAKKTDMAKLYQNVKSMVGSKPIWVTEVGFPSDPRYQEARRPGYGYPAGEDGQAAYLKDVLPYLLSLGVDKVFWYNLVDVPKDKSEFCNYGLFYIPGKQCVGDSAGRTTGGELKTKKAFEIYKSLTK